MLCFTVFAGLKTRHFKGVMGAAIAGMPACVSHVYYHSALEYTQINFFRKFSGDMLGFVRKNSVEHGMTKQSIDEMILDPGLSDDAVHDELVNAPMDGVPDVHRDGLTHDEWIEQMEAFQEQLNRQGELLRKHRPQVWERIVRETLEQHNGCCGGCGGDEGCTGGGCKH